MRSLLRAFHKDRRKCPPMGKLTRYALYFALISTVWFIFKQVEPTVAPVVTGFKITKAKTVNDHQLAISGTMNKRRDCDFISVLAYSGDKFLAIEFEAKSRTSRLTGEQSYGPWLITPETSQLKLYSRHICTTGRVLTVLFDGAIVQN